MDLNIKINENMLEDDNYLSSVNFTFDGKFIPPDNVIKNINNYSTYQNEMNSCNSFNFNITLYPIMTNVLYNKKTHIYNKQTGVQLTGTERLNKIQTIDDINYDYKLGLDILDNNYTHLNTFFTGTTLNDFVDKKSYGYLSIKDTINNNIINRNNWYSIKNKVKIGGNKMFKTYKPNEYIDLYPTREHFLFTDRIENNVIINNWDYLITYPYAMDKDNFLVKSELDINGIPMSSYSFTDNYAIFTTQYKHGLSKDDTIKINLNDDYNDEIYIIYNVGDESNDDKEHSFRIDLNKYVNIKDRFYHSNYYGNARFINVINNVDSEYYLRIFKQIPNMEKNGYNLSFAKTIYNDPVYQLQYIDDLDVSNLTDNLNRPLTEVYLTILKKYNDEFCDLSSGIEMSTGVYYYNIKRMNNENSNSDAVENKHVFEFDINSEYEKFYGDIVEYNKTIFKEKTLDTITHRFNTLDRREYISDLVFNEYNSTTNVYVSNTYNLYSFDEGYIYKPHHKINIKNFSNTLINKKLPIVEICGDFKIITGETATYFDGQNLSTDNDVKFLLLKPKDISLFVNNDYVRLTNNNNEYINVKIIKYGDFLEIKYNNLLSSDKAFLFNNGFYIANFTINRYIDNETPLYAQDLGNGKCVYREILNNGVYSDNSELKEEFVFTNNRFYVNKNFNFYLKRQDPFNNFYLNNNIDLYDGVFGDSIETLTTSTNNIISNNEYETTIKC